MASVSNFVADGIRELRRLRRISQARLGERLGASKNTASRWETYIYTPSIAELEKVAEILEVDVMDIVARWEQSERQDG